MSTVPYRSKPSALDALADRADRLGTPISAMIEIADRCNEVCIHCYQIQGQKGEMSTAEVYAVLEQLAELGVLFLTISGGEATLRDDFVDIVRKARELRFAVKLYTNGLTMDEALADELAALAVQEVQVSLYSHRAEMHDFVTRVPGSFERTTRAVRLLRERKIAVVLKTPLMTLNSSPADRAAYVALASALDADHAMDPTLDGREDGDRTPEGMRLDEAALRELYADPTMNEASSADAPPRDPDAGLCGACSSALVVEPNGEVRPCTSFAVPLGNARSEGIAASFRSNDAARGIRALRWGDVRGCRECAISGHCHRCHANARREAGDALAPYASACVAARARYGAALGRDVRVLSSDAETMGPYRLEADGGLRTFRVEPTADDEALAARLPFVRTEAKEPAAPFGPGDLVQIRRPGKKPRTEAIPTREPAT